MDDVLLYGRTTEEFKEKLEKFLSFYIKKNLKLNISKQVEFGGTLKL